MLPEHFVEQGRGAGYVIREIENPPRQCTVHHTVSILQLHYPLTAGTRIRVPLRVPARARICVCACGYLTLVIEIVQGNDSGTVGFAASHWTGGLAWRSEAKAINGAAFV